MAHFVQVNKVLWSLANVYELSFQIAGYFRFLVFIMLKCKIYANKNTWGISKGKTQNNY